MQSGILEEMVQAEFKTFKPEVAVLAIGATEVHGMHLPFGCDTFQVDSLTRAAVKAANAEGGRVLMLPTMPYGIDTNLMEFPYTLSIPPSTLMLVVRDLVDSMAHHGVRKFLMVNGHGGNTSTLETICREYVSRKIFLATVNGWAVAWEVVQEVIKTETEHACEFETSLGLALMPDLVRMDLARPSPTHPCRLEKLTKYGGKFTRPWHLFTVNGGVGHPELATKEKGERIVKAIVERLKEVLLELCQTEMNETFPY